MEPIIFLLIITALLITNVVYAYKTKATLREVERNFDQLQSRLNKISLAEKRVKSLERINDNLENHLIMLAKEKSNQKPKQHIRAESEKSNTTRELLMKEAAKELNDKSTQSHTGNLKGFKWPNNDTGV